MVVTNNKKSSKGLKIFSIFLIVLAIVYLLMPIDFDGPIIGLTDDFMVFMAAFCFCASQFVSAENAKRKLRMLSIIFISIAVLMLLLLAFTPLVYWLA